MIYYDDESKLVINLDAIRVMWRGVSNDETGNVEYWAISYKNLPAAENDTITGAEADRFFKWLDRRQMNGDL